MKFNKILSTALVLILLFSSVIVLFPAKTSAAYVESQEAISAPKDIATYVSAIYAADSESEVDYTGYKKYEFNTAEEMFLYEYSLGYLKSVNSANGKYSMYVNAYTGVIYYINNVTGQILTSNPWYYSNKNTDEVDRTLLSQIEINFSEVSNSTSIETYNSTEWAAERGQIKTEYIKNGIRVNYTLGNTQERELLPHAMEASKFEELIYIPMLKTLRKLLEDNCPKEDYNDEYDFENKTYALYDENGNITITGMRKYLIAVQKEFDTYRVSGVPLSKANPAVYNEIKTLHTDINRMTVNYQFYAKDNSKNKYPGFNVYILKDGVIETDVSELFRKYSGAYTASEMLADEKAVGCVVEAESKPVFKCSLEYSFNEDGSISTRLPASSISFDETLYILSSINVLPYFGASELDRENDGYVFYPDGSGTVIEFKDFLELNPLVSGTVYGADYCYSSITGARVEQITMPVFGIVTETDANPSIIQKYGVKEVTNGYFAIIEEGASLANIVFNMKTSAHKFGHVFCSYNPYPSDQYDLSDTLSVGGAAFYTMVAESKYTGSYVTRYVMLDDEKLDNKGNVSSYMGMVNYYRNYLYHVSGTLTALETVTNDLPLYIEVLGSMEIVKKILTFPVTTSIPLTSFEDITKMYEELSSSKVKYEEEAAKYDELAATAATESEKLQYQAAAADCRKLAVDIKNINFRLTGFANGGLYSTYPTKVKWSRACGGKSGFKKLIESAAAISAKEDANLGIYPDFDFSYINNTEMFDGISKKGNVSKMVDNRYASKQTYNSVLQEYESVLALVINPEALNDLYSKFLKKYSKYDISSISVSTLGSDLNSNFDEDEPVNRDEAEEYVSEILNKMKNENKYDIMTDKGNVFTLKYAKHILNASIDSSHLSYSSYTIPFVGMVLHGSINYTGTPINYSGTIDYDILRAIESGANLYYILAYNSENIGHMKEDEMLNKYYGVDYSTWNKNILETYKELNDAIGSLQTSKIVDHRIVKGERVIESSEWDVNYRLLIEEFVKELDAYIADGIDEKYNSASIGTKLKVEINKAALLTEFAQRFNCNYDSASASVVFPVNNAEISVVLNTAIAAIEEKYERYANGDDNFKLTVDTLDYDSEYSFVTDSAIYDKDYVITNYTSDLDNIVVVTYENGTQFILNYNIYSVNVRIDANTVYTIGKYGYIKIEAKGGNA